MSFARYLRRVLPGSMQGGVMPLLLDGVGGVLDDLKERTVLGRMAGLPYPGNPPAKRANGSALQCEEDALPYHAGDRGIRIYATEPIASQRYRLSRWRQLHAQRGTHLGAMRHLQPYFLGADGTGVLPRLRVVHQDGAGAGATWHTLSGTADLLAGAYPYLVHREVPSNWNFDGQTALWSRWWGIIYLTGTAFDMPALWDDGTLWDGGAVWDGIRGAILDDWIAMFIDWSAAHSRCAGIILVRDLGDFYPNATAVTDPDGWTSLPVGNWGKLVDPTTGKPTRLPTATWIYDRYFS